MIKEMKTAAQLEKLVMAACKKLPIKSVRVYRHSTRGWYAMFFAKPGYSKQLKARFADTVATLRKDYELEKDVGPAH